MSNNKHPRYSSFHNKASRANNDSEEENDESDLSPQQVERIYSQLSTHVHPLEKKSGTYPYNK